MAATSASNAWAVGSYPAGISIKTLILRWNGRAWKQVPSPSPGKGLANFLSGVAATTAGGAWAVGDITGGGPGISLILRWNGTVWKRVPSPTPAGGAGLFGVAAVSARGAWAVGDTMTGDTSFGTVILRWNGTAWKQVPSPSPKPSAELSGVAATSASNAWAVGGTFNSTGSKPPPKTLILRWNGKTWK